MRTRALYIAAIFLCVTIIWSRALANGFVWDDHVLIEKNEETLRSSSLANAFSSDFWNTDTETGHSRYYRPLVTLSYMVDYAMYGLRPSGYHLTNLLIHGAVTATLFVVLTTISISPLLAALCALLWGVHPHLGESVAWISGRTDSLATLFMLLSVLMALRGYSTKPLNKQLHYFSAVLFGCALLSKESAIVTPLISKLLLPLSSPKAKVSKSYWAPYMIVGLLWLLARSMALANAGLPTGDDGMPPLLAFLGFLHVWGGVLWPPFFRIEYGNSLTSTTLYPGALCGGAIMVALLWLGRTHRVTRPVRALAILALVSCVPALLAVFTKSVIGARLVYTGSAFALCALVAFVPSQNRRSTHTTASLILIALLGLGTLQRSTLWINDQTLFSMALTAQTPSTRNHLNLGIALYDDGDLQGAYEQLTTDMDTAAQGQQHYMLSLLYTCAGCEALAEQELRTALKTDPAYYSATHNLAGLLSAQGRRLEAQQLLENCAKNFPDNRPKALAQIAFTKRLPGQAERPPLNAEWCSQPQALRTFFTSPLPLNRQAGQFLQQGQFELAHVLLKAALRADPAFTGAQLNLAQLRAISGDSDGARAILENILMREPNEHRASKLLGALSQESNSQVR